MNHPETVSGSINSTQILSFETILTSDQSMVFKLALAAALLISKAFAAPVIPLAPTEDPFYTPPVGFETNYKPGDIIAHRPVPGTLSSILLPEKIKNSWQFLVRSEDSHGNANAIVTTLIEPYNADPSKLLSFQPAQDTVFLNCAPSYQLQVGVAPDTTAPLENILAIAGLDQGWYVVVPDYEGPKSAFAAGYQEGKATLNSIRAVLKSGDLTGIDSDPTITLWGYSGGTIPTGWAVNLAPTYAPELHFAGAAVGGIVANLTSIVEYLSGTLFAGFAVNGIVGLANEYPEINTLVQQQTLPAHTWRIKYVKTVCLIEVLISQAFVNVWSMFKSGFNILYDSQLQSVLKKHSMNQPDLLPNTPLFFYHAISDEIVPFDPVDSLYENWCSRGVSIDFQVDETGEHITEAVLGAGKAFVWLIDRMNGYETSGCNRDVNLSNALDLRAIIAFGAVIVDALGALLQLPVGPADKLGLAALVG